MNVGEVTELAREWVEAQGSQTPGFLGAHLMGGLNYATKDAPFPSYGDVDLNLIVQGAGRWDVVDLPYQGLILEYGLVSADAYRSPEVVLADPRLASNLAVYSLLADPTGMLATLHAAVAREYPRRRWVQARVAAARDAARRSLAEVERAGSLADGLVQLNFLMIDLAGLVALANLTPPTHRRCLVVAKEVLGPVGRLDLHEDMLGVLGCAQWGRTQVESYLPVCERAFDRACAVTRTPIPYGFKLRPHVKPYVVEGAQEMIIAGHHREAMLWITLALWVANTAIQMDAPEHERPGFQRQFDQLVVDMGLKAVLDLTARVARATDLADRLFEATDELLRRNPRITD